MTLLTWNHDCSVDIRAIDDQHGILMDTINDLRLAFMHECGREQALALLQRLIELTRMHFSFEESLMQEADYPGLLSHRAEHQRMCSEMLQAEHRLQNDDQFQTDPCCSPCATVSSHTSKASIAPTPPGSAIAESLSPTALNFPPIHPIH